MGWQQRRLSIAGDAFDKLLLAQVVQEKSPAGAISQSSFIYETFEKYHAEIEYKVVNPQVTTLYVVPSSLLDLYNQIIYWTSPIPIHTNMGPSKACQEYAANRLCCFR